LRSVNKSKIRPQGLLGRLVQRSSVDRSQEKREIGWMIARPHDVVPGAWFHGEKRIRRFIPVKDD
jgi:hypothetical protein